MAEVKIREQQLCLAGNGIALARCRDGTRPLLEHKVRFLAFALNIHVHNRTAGPPALEDLLGDRVF